MHISRTLLAAGALIALCAGLAAGGSAATPSAPPKARASAAARKPAAAKHAAPPAAGTAKSAVQFGDANISADEIDLNNKDGSFTMPHRVTMTRPGSDAVGDSAKGNFKQKVVTISGNVVVHQTRPAGSFGKLGEKPSTLTTNELTIDWGNKIYTANGAVHFVQGERTMTADRGTLNETTHELDLSGNVHVDEADRSASADSVQYNTLTEDVKMQGNVLVRFPSETAAPAAPAAATPAPPKKKKRSILR